MSGSIDKQLGALEKQTEELKRRLAMATYADASSEQVRALGHFLNRALQMSEGSALLCRAKLGTPFVVLMRVLCEDLFLCVWIAQSEKNASEYSSGVTAEVARLMRTMLTSGRATIRDKSTREDKTDEVMPRLHELKAGRLRIDQLAEKLGLSKVYDLIYRFPSLEVHGKAFGLPSTSEGPGLHAALSATILLVKAIGLVADNRALRDQGTKPDEVLRLLRIEDIAGK